MKDATEIVILGEDKPTVDRFAEAFRTAKLRFFKVAFLPARKIISEPDFDALYWTLPAAERWNVRPVEDVIQIVRTSEADRREGWPDYLLVGLALSAPNAVDLETGFRAWSRALLNALAEPASATISRVKVPMDMIALERLDPKGVANTLADAERELD
ncbi:MAG TPA: hypothetical protein VGC72_04595 [Candidatus Elarobacter sp.]|jgi:hypothetical protein